MNLMNYLKKVENGIKQQKENQKIGKKLEKFKKN